MRKILEVKDISKKYQSKKNEILALENVSLMYQKESLFQL